MIECFSYIHEYGFPSTHAMFATGIPLSIVLLSHQRYDVTSIDKTNEIDPSSLFL